MDFGSDKIYSRLTLSTSVSLLSRASKDEMIELYGNAFLTFLSEELSNETIDNCFTIGCVSWKELDKAFDEIYETPEYVYILYVNFIIKEGPDDETSTNEIVSRMTNFIKENSFEINVDGMNIKGCYQK